MVTDILEKCSASIFRVKQPKKSTGMLEPEDSNSPPLNIGNLLNTPADMAYQRQFLLSHFVSM